MSSETLRTTEPPARTTQPLPRAAPPGPAPVVWDLTGAVDRCLADFLETEILALGEIDPALVPFATTARDLAMSGGKRLRPRFAYWGWRGATGGHGDPADAVPAFAALEMLHTFALLHDDVMDGSDTRRGAPTAHRAYAAAHARQAWHGDPDQFGTSAAILAGDLCLVWADRLIAEATLQAHRVVAARRVYDRMRVEAMAGQYLDMLGEATPDAWSIERALRVARYKSASYTVIRPLEFGAALSGPGPQPALLEVYRRYGGPVGEAFQLRDDILGLYGDPAETGKPAGDDLRRGKPTALVTLARHRAGPAARRVIDGCLREGSVTPDRVARLRAVITATGARAEVEQMIGERIRTATAVLADAPLDRPVRDALARLAHVAAYRAA